jgi:hypothetical protein
MICKRCKEEIPKNKGWCYHCDTCEDCLNLGDAKCVEDVA